MTLILIVQTGQCNPNIQKFLYHLVCQEVHLCRCFFCWWNFVDLKWDFPLWWTSAYSCLCKRRPLWVPEGVQRMGSFCFFGSSFVVVSVTNWRWFYAQQLVLGSFECQNLGIQIMETINVAVQCKYVNTVQLLFSNPLSC